MIKKIRLVLAAVVGAGMCMVYSFPASGDEVNQREMMMRMTLQESDYFMYQVTYKTLAKRYYPHSDVPNEYYRELSYYVEQRINTIGTDGIVKVDANVDSINIFVKKGQAITHFNSQDPADLEVMNLNDPELKGTTTILNKPFQYRMTLDGDYIDHSGWESYTNDWDTSKTVDAASRFAWEEYMNDDFLRSLLLISAGFTYDRKYYDLQEWRQAIPQLIFKTPVEDSAGFSIEISKNHKIITSYANGTLHLIDGKHAIHEQELADPLTLDSITGTSRDTFAFAEKGFVKFHSRTSDMREHGKTSDKGVPFDETIHETMEVKLLDYSLH